ncbi:unnamed protein product, partial [Rotaria sordida]
MYYILSTVVNILYSCAYPESISLPADMANRTTVHGLQQHHELIVNWTFIAISKPYDLEQRKAYYHAKSPTNYALKIQITYDLHHRI